MKEFCLPKGFLMGTATASVQIEGGDTGNTWYNWCLEGHIIDNSNCINANNHWNRVSEDIELLKELNVDIHRMSIEWSRIQPSKDYFSKEAVLHYRNEISVMLDKGIKPLITLHHFSEPIWFHDEGSWEKSDNINFFLEYVRYIVEELGDIVSDWVTFNEPNVFTYMGYVTGMWPPGKTNILATINVQSSIIKAHVKAYELIHDIRTYKEFKGKTRVGCAMHIRIFEGAGFLGNLVASMADYLFNNLLFEGTVTGKMGFPLNKKDYIYKPGKYVDFIGINYYTRSFVKFALKPSALFYEEADDGKYEKTESGWDIYPEGLYMACKKYYEKYKLPIYITENGINEKCEDKKISYISKHLAMVEKAIKDGIPVERYYYWTLMDNFEWHEGETTRFGLVSCDFKSQQRKMRKSGWFYSQICKLKKCTFEVLQNKSVDT